MVSNLVLSTQENLRKPTITLFWERVTPSGDRVYRPSRRRSTLGPLEEGPGSDPVGDPIFVSGKGVTRVGTDSNRDP